MTRTIPHGDVDCGPLEVVKKPGRKPAYYLNVSASFDIETTSFYEHGQKRACMYAFVFTLNGRVWTGRTWEELFTLLSQIKRFYGVNKKDCRLPIYVHNLSFEFGFIWHLFHWEEVFSLSERKPVRALTSDGFEFRCSYFLSGYGLQGVGNNLQKYKVQKLVGDLDYSLMRHSKTPLTEKEWGYIVNDGLVVSAYIQEQIEKYKSVARIPMTKTGVVREYCRNECFYHGKSHSMDRSGKYNRYQFKMRHLTIDGEKEYRLLKQAFQGGFTHANMYASGRTYHDVTSYDFTSSYPAVMVTEQFPMGKGRWYKPKDRADFLKKCRIYCCIFEIEFTGIEAKTTIDHPISSSRCTVLEGGVFDNGRIIKAKRIRTTITNIDFEIYRKFYRWKSSRIGEVLLYNKGYLPRDFVMAVLKLYKDKTELKGVEDELSKARYAWAKELLNACYGMSVTDPCRASITLTDEGWGAEEPNIENAIKKYNESRSRFLFYPWGVFVTAYARRNLFSGLLACGDDYLYADTDSVKITNAEKHERYFKRYNAMMKRKIERASKEQNIPLDYFKPKTVKGEEKPIGLWDWDGFYVRFRTLGSKRYLVEYPEPHEYAKGKFSIYSITIAGVNKKTAIPGLEALAKKKHKDIFDLFEFGLYFDPSICGKNLHTYLDEPMEGEFRDYLGNLGTYKEYSGVHLEPTGYLMESTPDYLRILGLIKDGYYIE